MKALSIGRVGVSGHVDGPISEALFNTPSSIALGRDGAVYILDSGNGAIRLLKDGNVSTFARVRDQNDSTRPCTGQLATGHDGALYFADTMCNVIKRINDAGLVEVIAGTGQAGVRDGPVLEATFSQPFGLAIDPRGVIYISDAGNSIIRSISNGLVSKLAGSSPNFSDGPVASARFSLPLHLVYDQNKATIFVSDSDNCRIRAVRNGVVSTVAGSGTPGSDDGNALTASIMYPGALDLDRSTGDLYVSDGDRVRRISKNRVSTWLDKTSDMHGDVDGFVELELNAKNSLLRLRRGIAFDPQHRLLIVTSPSKHMIRIICLGNQRQDGLVAPLPQYFPKAIDASMAQLVNIQNRLQRDIQEAGGRDSRGGFSPGPDVISALTQFYTNNLDGLLSFVPAPITIDAGGIRKFFARMAEIKSELSSLILVHEGNEFSEAMLSLIKERDSLSEQWIPKLVDAIKQLDKAASERENHLSQLSSAISRIPNAFHAGLAIPEPVELGRVLESLRKASQISARESELKETETSFFQLLEQLGDLLRRRQELIAQLADADPVLNIVASASASAHSTLAKNIGDADQESRAVQSQLADLQDHLRSLRTSQSTREVLEVSLRQIEEIEECRADLVLDRDSMLVQLDSLNRMEPKLRTPARMEKRQRLEVELLELKQRIEALDSKKQQLASQIMWLKDQCPEVAVLARHVLPKLPSAADRFLVKRNLREYSEVRNIDGRVNIKAAIDPQGRPCVLKLFALQNATESTKFQKEISILRKLHDLNHPLLVRPEALFIESSTAYLQMPFYSNGTLANWLFNTNPRPDEDKIRRVLHQVCQAISVLHREAILHRDIKLENVMMRDDSIPVLIDFDVSKDVSANGSQATLTHVGTFEYIAPEVRAGKAHTFASDIFSLGVLLFKAKFTGEQLDPEFRRFPPCENKALLHLLSKMICVDPDSRLSIEEVLVHPFFTASTIEDLQSTGQLVDFGKKFAAVKALVRHLRSMERPQSELTINRARLILDVIANFQPMIGTTTDFSIHFEGEYGIDASGLTSALYRGVFTEMMEESLNLFVRKEGSSVYLPSRTADVQKMKVIGYMIVRCMLDERVADIRLAPSVWRYFLDLPILLQDLEAVDAELYRNEITYALTASADHLEALCLSFPGPNGEEIEVTDQNRRDYAKWSVNQRLVVEIQPQLDALKEGFFSIEQLSPLIKLLSPSDLKCLLCGEEFISGEMLMSHVKFEGFPAASQTPAQFEQLMQELSQQQLRKLLVFVTEQTAIPMGGFVDTVGQRRLDLPDYNNYEHLKGKLLLAIEELSYQNM